MNVKEFDTALYSILGMQGLLFVLLTLVSFFIKKWINRVDKTLGTLAENYHRIDKVQAVIKSKIDQPHQCAMASRIHFQDDLQ